MGAPTIQSDFVLNEIEVQVSDDNSSTWHRLRDYQLAYDQAAPPLITDPITGLQESVAGKFNLTQLSVIGDDNVTVMPSTQFTYSRQYEYYEDMNVLPNPATNCGNYWNTGIGAGCVLWSQSYQGNSYYLASVSNGLGLSQTFTWVDNRDNMHGVSTGGHPYDPSYCTGLQVPGPGGNTYPCNVADDATWSRISLTQETNSMLRLTQAGQGGTKSQPAILGITNYTYTIATGLAAPKCIDCTQGYSWGDNNDNDYLDFYNGKFMDFSQVGVSNPDGSTEAHKFYSTEGWGLYDTSKVTVGACVPPLGNCYNDPWWDIPNQTSYPGQSNALHGHEYELDRYAIGGSVLLQQVLTQYAAICRPPWITSPTPPVTGYGDFGLNLVAELDPGNPIAVCDVRTTQVDNKTIDGSTNPSPPDQTTTYTYETGTLGSCPTCFGRVIKQTTASNDGGSPTTIGTGTSYIWNDATSASGHVTSTSATGPYLISFPALVDKENASSTARYQCTYNGYDQVASGTSGQNSGLIRADPTRQDRYTNCGTAAQGYNDRTGPITTTSGFDSGSGPYGNPWWSNDGDANAGNGAHLGCTVNAVPHSACTAFDTYFKAFSITQANALFQASSTGYQPHGSATATDGFGTWPMSTTDANSQPTTYTYDALGRQTSTTLPNEATGLTTQTMAYTVWCLGTVAQSPCAEIDQTQRLNSTTTVTNRAFYDGMGHLVETRSPAPSGDIVQYYFYDPSQRLAFKSVPYLVAAYVGAAGSAAYSIPDTLVTVLGTPGTTTSYDGLGRTTSVTDPKTETTSSGYTVVCSPPDTGDSACYEQVAIVDPLSHQSGVLTDALGRTDYVQAFTGTTVPYPVYATTKNTYDYLGDLIQILHPDGVTSTTFQYDMTGRQTGLTDPDRGGETYIYDQDGNLTTSIDARQGSAGAVVASYDGIDRPVSRSDGTHTPYDTYTYGITSSNFSIGRLVSETFSGAPNTALSGNDSYVYDKRGQQTSATLTVGSTPYSLGTSFDDAGNVLTQTYPDGEVVTNSLGAQGWLSGVSTQQGSTNTTLLTGIAYSGTVGAYGSMTSANTYPSGSFNFGYDLLGRLNSTSFQSPLGADLSEQLNFDPAGNVSTISSNVAGATDNQAFCYDEQNRLTWAASTGTAPCTNVPITTGTIPSYSQTFVYDTLGRLTSGPLGAYTYGDPTTHVHAATAIGSAYTASYDASGDMTCRAPSSATTCVGTQTGAQLTYNNEGQLSNWQNQLSGPTSTASYLYDGQGNRVAQQTTSGSTTTTTVYSGGWEEDTSVNGGQPTHTTYYYANGRRIAVAVNGTFNYLATDALGSASVAVAKASPYGVTATTLYAPYGSVRYASGTMPTDHGFTGQIADSTSGLDYYGARYYDPVAGEFGSADTVLPGKDLDIWGLSRYAYVEGNPVNRTDATGHCTTEKCFLDANSSDNTTHLVPGGEKPTGRCDTACLVEVRIITTAAAQQPKSRGWSSLLPSGAMFGLGGEGYLGVGVASIGTFVEGFFGGVPSGPVTGASGGAFASFFPDMNSNPKVASVPNTSDGAPGASIRLASGAYAGAGLDLAITNAPNAQALRGPFTVLAGGAGIGPASATFHLAVGSNGTYVLSVSPPLLNYGFGVFGAVYDTVTCVSSANGPSC